MGVKRCKIGGLSKAGIVRFCHPLLKSLHILHLFDNLLSGKFM